MADTDGKGETHRRESRATRIGRVLLAPVVAWALRALALTWRLELVGGDPIDRPAGQPILAAFWHQDVIISSTVYRDLSAEVPVSQSRDGEHISAVLRHLGYGDPPRGSSSRGGSGALRAIVRRLKAGCIVGFLVDGPRGPARVPKPGIIAAARISGQPILPIALVAHPRILFGSWDRTQLPLPFAHVVVAYGEPMPVEKDPENVREEAALKELAARLEAVRETALARLRA